MILRHGFIQLRRHYVFDVCRAFDSLIDCPTLLHLPAFDFRQPLIRRAISLRYAAAAYYYGYAMLMLPMP